MPSRDTFIDFLLDQLRGVQDVTSKRMFGGVGLYSGTLFFAIVYDEVVYFKVDEANRDEYVRAGTKPFKPYRDRPMTMQYYEVPASVLEDADELSAWAERAISAAGRKKTTKKQKIKRRETKRRKTHR